MNKLGDVTIKINLNEDAYTELQIMAMRKKIHVRDLIANILNKYSDKNKESTTSG